MDFPTVLRPSRRRSSGSSDRRGLGPRHAVERPHAIGRRHAVEPLEERVLMSTYAVTGLGDDAGSITPAGPGTFTATTLRAAVTAANADAGADTINFADGLTGAI